MFRIVGEPKFFPRSAVDVELVDDVGAGEIEIQSGSGGEFQGRGSEGRGSVLAW